MSQANFVKLKISDPGSLESIYWLRRSFGMWFDVDFLGAEVWYYTLVVVFMVVRLEEKNIIGLEVWAFSRCSKVVAGNELTAMSAQSPEKNQLAGNEAGEWVDHQEQLRFVSCTLSCCCLALKFGSKMAHF